MILQSDVRFKKYPFADYGCDLMVALWYVNKLQNFPFTPEGIEDWIDGRPIFYKNRKPMPIIGKNLFVNSWDNVARQFGLAVLQDATFEAADYKCDPGEYQVLFWHRPEHDHATGGDGKGHVTYDPLGESLTVRYGAIQRCLVLRWRTWRTRELLGER